MARTHILFGLLFGLVAIQFLDYNIVLFLGMAAIGSILADVDHSGSKINRLLPVTRWVPYLFKHRGFFHSVFPIFIIYFLFYNINYTIGLALSVGYLAHLFSDGLTKAGVNLLHPLSNLKIKGFIETGGMAEKAVMVVVALILVAAGIIL